MTDMRITRQGSILGGAVKRVEDPRFITGEGGYLDDIETGGYVAHFVRSPVPHGVIVAIDTDEAAAMPGVVSVFTANDFSYNKIAAGNGLDEANARPLLASGKVRFVGEPLAVVVAKTAAQAADAADAVWPDIELIDSVATIDDALAPDAPRLFEELASNVVWEKGPVTSAADLAPADVVVSARLINQRLAAVPMEPNSAMAVPSDDGIELWLGSQNVYDAGMTVAKVLGRGYEDVRVRVPDMGGGFGAKIYTYPEQIVLVPIAERLDHPVQWIESRIENLTNMCHGRDQIQNVSIGATADGSILWIKGEILKNGGAYGMWGAAEPYLTQDMASGVYNVPQISLTAKSVVTNTVPNHAYRGAGRPEASAMVERLIDMLAAELSMDPVALRQKNMVGADQFPHRTSTGVTYDSGNYQAALDRALAIAEYDDLRAEQAQRRADNSSIQLGIGVSTYVEITALGTIDSSRVTINEDGSATMVVPTLSHGQSHETTFRQILSEQLKIATENIHFVQGDSRYVKRGGGTMASRSTQIGGSSVLVAGEAVLDKARRLVANQLEASTDDIVLFDGGRLGVAGVPDSALTWAEVAALAAAEEPREGEEPGLQALGKFKQASESYPFGTHISVVEVDTDTGNVELLRHIAVDDCGYILNRMVVDGQVHGGVAIGIGQAMSEAVIYDDDGYLMSGNLTSYLIPSAMTVPSIEIDHTQTLTPLNPLGVKGIGESGTIGSTPAVQNAVVDAVRHLGIDHIDMPLTPSRVWAAIHSQA